MVVIGNFSARLVNAVTKEPFKEHNGSSGEIYAEVEPDVEYFVEVEVVGGEWDKRVIFTCFVDGKRLPMHRNISRSSGRDWKGLTSEVRHDGTRTETALCFRSARMLQRRVSSVGVSDMLMGTVTVQFSKEVRRESKPPRRFTQDFFCLAPSAPAAESSTLTAAVPSPLEKRQQEKVLRTSLGNFSQVIASQIDLHNQVGKVLQEININYCTAIGLIHAGVLPRPPLWEQHRQVFGLSDSDEEIEPVVPTKIIKVAAVYDDGTQIYPAKEVELFDLTINA